MPVTTKEKGAPVPGRALLFFILAEISHGGPGV